MGVGGGTTPLLWVDGIQQKGILEPASVTLFGEKIFVDSVQLRRGHTERRCR